MGSSITFGFPRLNKDKRGEDSSSAIFNLESMELGADPSIHLLLALALGQ